MPFWQALLFPIKFNVVPLRHGFYELEWIERQFGNIDRGCGPFFRAISAYMQTTPLPRTNVDQRREVCFVALSPHRRYSL